MSVETNRASAVKFWEHSETGNMALLDDLVASSFCLHESQVEVRNVEGWKRIVTGFKAAFPDIRADIVASIAEGDKVLCQVSLTGTHKGDLLGFSPSGNSITFTLMALHRYSNGKLAEMWVNADTLDLVQKLGGSRRRGKCRAPFR